MFTLGDVADILDNALDMGINIVEALHKLAEAGDKGQVSKDECLSQLELSGGAKEGDPDDQFISARTKRAGKRHGVYDDTGEVGTSLSLYPEEGQELNYGGLCPVGEFGNNSKKAADASYDWDDITNYVTVQDLDRESWSKKLHDFNEHEISPLRICSSNVRLQESDGRYADPDICDADDVEYYGTPLKKFKSKRWSNTFALNMENDNCIPQPTGNFASRQSSNESSDGAKDYYYLRKDDEDNYSSGDEVPKFKRKRRNTYSIETTPLSEAEDRGLPIIDMLDDLCAMADQFMDNDWSQTNRPQEYQIYPENKDEYYSSEDEIPPIASKSTDEKILALDNETARAYESITNAMQMDNEMSGHKQLGGDTATNAMSGPTLDQIVDQKIADIGSQAEIVLESFNSLKQLRQFEKQQDVSDLEDAQVLCNKDYEKNVDYNHGDDGHADLQRGDIILQEQPHRNMDDRSYHPAPIAGSAEDSDGAQHFEEVKTQTVKGDDFSLIYSSVVECFPCEFETVEDVTYHYTQSETVLNSDTNLSSSKSESNDCTDKKRPRTYVLDISRNGAADSVYEEPVFISANENDYKSICNVDDTHDTLPKNSDQHNVVKEERISTEVVSDETSTLNTNHDILKSSDSSDNQPEKPVETSKVARPGTYILNKPSQIVYAQFDIDNACMESPREEKEQFSSQSMLEHSDGSGRRSDTFVLENFDSGTVNVEHNADREVETDEHVVKKEIEKMECVPLDTVAVKKRPGTYVLETSAMSFTTTGDHYSQDVCPENILNEISDEAAIINDHKPICSGDDTHDTLPKNSEQHSVIEEEKVSTEVASDEASTMNISHDILKSSDSFDNRPEKPVETSKAARPGTYILNKPSQIVYAEFDIDDACMESPREEEEELSSQSMLELSDGSRRHPNTFVLENVDPRDDKVEHNAEEEVETDEHVMKKESEKVECVSLDTVAVKKRPGTYVLETSSMLHTTTVDHNFQDICSENILNEISDEAAIINDYKSICNVDDTQNTLPKISEQHSMIEEEKVSTEVASDEASTMNISHDILKSSDSSDNQPEKPVETSKVARPGTYILNKPSQIVYAQFDIDNACMESPREEKEQFSSQSMLEHSDGSGRRSDTFVLENFDSGTVNVEHNADREVETDEHVVKKEIEKMECVPLDTVAVKKRPGTYVLETSAMSFTTTGDHYSQDVCPENILNEISDEAAIINDHKPICSGDDTHDTLPKNSEQHSVIEEEKVSTEVASDEASTMNISHDILKSSDSFDNRPEKPVETSKAARPGTYILNKPSQIVYAEFDIDDACMKSPSEEKEQLSSQSMLELSDGSRRHPSTFVLENVIPRDDNLEHNADREVETDEHIMKREIENVECVSLDTIAVKKRPGTYVLETSSMLHTTTSDHYSQDICSENVSKEVNDETAIVNDSTGDSMTKEGEDIDLEMSGSMLSDDVKENDATFSQIAAEVADDRNYRENMYTDSQDEKRETGNEKNNDCQRDDVINSSNRLSGRDANDLTRLSLNNQSLDVTEKACDIEGSDIEDVSRQASKVTSNQEETLPKKARPGTYVLDKSTMFHPIATDVFVIDVKAEENDPVNSHQGAMDVSHGIIASKQYENGGAEGMKRDVRVRKPRPSTYKIDKALSRVLQASGELFSETTSSSVTNRETKGVALNESNSSMQYDEFSKKSDAWLGYSVPKFKTVSDIMFTERTEADDNKNDREKRFTKTDQWKTNFDNRLTNAREPRVASFDNEEALEVRGAPFDNEWNVFERNFIPHSQFSENITEGLLFNDSVQKTRKSWENEAGLNLKDELSKNATKPFNEKPAKSFNNQAAIFDVTGEEEGGSSMERGHLHFASVRGSLASSEQFDKTVVKNKPLVNINWEPSNENQDTESNEGVVKTDRFKRDPTAMNEALISSSEKRLNMTMNNSEMNNNDLRTVEKDFSFNSDCTEMADECAVLSTFAHSDCCADERVDNYRAAGFDGSKEPVIARVDALKKSQRHASAKVITDYPAEGYRWRSTAYEDAWLQGNSSDLTRDSKVEDRIPVTADACNRFLKADDEYDEAIISRCNLENSAENVTTHLDETVGNKSRGFRDMKLDEGDDMNGGKIALKLEINFADAFENGANSKNSSRDSGVGGKNAEDRDTNRGQGGRERVNEEGFDFVDRRNDKDSKNIKLKLHIDKPKTPGCEEDRRSSQGIRFDIDLENGNKKAVGPPGDLKKRLSVRHRPKREKVDRPGTYVLNSPVFSRDDYVSEEEFHERFSRKSLGSSEGGDLRYEIKRAIEQGRLELNIDNLEDDGIWEKEGFDFHSDRKLYSNNDAVKSREQPGQNLAKQNVYGLPSSNNDQKLFRRSLGMEFSNGMKREAIGESSLHQLKDVKEVGSKFLGQEKGGNEVIDGTDREVVSRSSKRTGTYVLYEGSRKKNTVDDESEICHSMLKEFESSKMEEEREISNKCLRSSPRPGTYVLQSSELKADLERNEEVRGHNHPIASPSSPRTDVMRKESKKKEDKGSKKETFEKFRKSFGNQRIGFFVDLKNDDNNLDVRRSKESNSQAKNSDEDFQGNYNGAFYENSVDNESIDLRFLKSENSVKELRSEINTITDVCTSNQEIKGMPMFNNSTPQSMDNAVSTHNYKENYHLIKSTIEGSEKVLDPIDLAVVRSTSGSLDPENAKIGRGDLHSRVISEKLSFTTGNHENIIHRRSSSLPLENERKLRYSSWDITPDTEKEVLGKITSLKECPSNHSMSDDITEGLDPIDVEESHVITYVNDAGEIENRRESLMSSVEKVYEDSDSGNAPTQFDRRFVAGYGPMKGEGGEDRGFGKKPVNMQEKLPLPKGDCSILGEEFNMEDIRNKRMSGETEGTREAPKGEMKEGIAKIVRRSTFIIRSEDDAEGSKLEGKGEIMDIESNKNLPIPSFKDFEKSEEERRKIAADISSKISLFDDAGKITPGLVRNTDNVRTSGSICHTDALKSRVELNEAVRRNEDILLKRESSNEDKDGGMSYTESRRDRTCQDEAVVEDYDLYISNGSRPASGISDNQPENERRRSDEMASRASSAISSIEDLELEGGDARKGAVHYGEKFSPDARCQIDNVAAVDYFSLAREPFSSREAPGIRIERQLSDSVVSLSNRGMTTDGGNGAAKVYDEAQRNPVSYFERQHSDNFKEAKDGVQDGKEAFVNHRTFASMPSLENDLRTNPFKIPRADRRQNFGHRPTSYDVTRKPLLERLERLCTFMSKSLTKLNNMNEGGSEIVSKLDRVHGKEDLFIRRKASSTSNGDSESESIRSGNGDRERIHDGAVLSSFQEGLENVDESRTQSDGDSEVKLRETKLGANRGQTYVIQGKDNLESEKTNGEANSGAVSSDDGSKYRYHETRKDYDVSSPQRTLPNQHTPWKVQGRRGLLLAKIPPCK